MPPLLSIILPTYNGQSTVVSSINSIINQNFRDWELIIIDDGSTDDTLSIISKFTDPRIQIISDHENRGLPYRLNQAIDKATGTYFARMDQDDISYPSRFSDQLEFLRIHPHVDLVGACMIFFKDKGFATGKLLVKSDHKEIVRRPWDSIPIPHPTWLSKMSWIRKYRYSTTSILSEDQDLLLRAHLTSIYACLPKILLGYRQNNITISKEVKSRTSYSLDLLRFYYQKGNFKILPLIFIFQASKIFIVAIATLSGLHHRVLYRRSVPLSLSEITEWNLYYEKFANRAFN